MKKCVICGKEADSRGLCRGHYVAAKRLHVLDRFPRLVRSSIIMETEVKAYLAQGDGGKHPKSRESLIVKGSLHDDGPRSARTTSRTSAELPDHPKSQPGAPGFAECKEHGLKFKNLQGYKHHITSIHLKGARA